MGYELTSFTVAIDEELQCPICTMVLKNPVQTPCKHAFCNNCIREWLSVRLVCPVDRQQVTIADLRPPSRLLSNLLGKLLIKCDFYDAGCLEVLRLDNLENHYATCSYNPNTEVTCDRCGLKLSRREYQESGCLGHYATELRFCRDTISKLIQDEQVQRNEKENAVNQISQLKSTVAELKDEVTQLRQTNKNLNDKLKKINNPNKINNFFMKNTALLCYNAA